MIPGGVKRLVTWTIIAILLLTGSILPSQVPSNPIGQNPYSLKWNQINTDKVQVIFPEGLEERGLRVAQWAHFFWENPDSTIGSINEKVTILVNNQPVAGNGFVTVGPYRSELFPTPRQFWASHYFLDNLTIHEYRHIQQFNNSARGITKTVKKVLGSWAWGGMLSMALPRWYLEGDAVIAETEYTSGGRGRWSPFLMEYQSLAVADRKYGFEKAAAGSLKDFVPSWYHLGYQMLTVGRDEFGDDIWAKVSDDAVRFKGILFPFSGNLKKRTGWNAKRLYIKAIDRIQNQWSQSETSGLSDRAQKINIHPKKTVEHYNNPHFTGDSTWVAVFNSYERLSTMVQIDQKGEVEVLFEPGVLLQSTTGSISVAGNKVAWTAYSQDPRWQNKTYSDIFIYHLGNRERYQLTHEGRYFSPEISPDGQTIAAIRVEENLSYSVVILDLESGDIKNEIDLKGYREGQFPTWDDAGNIILVGTNDDANQLVRIGPVGDTLEELMSPVAAMISHPVYHDNKVYFSWGPSAPNNIYVLDITSGHIVQITYSAVGAFQPDVSADGRSLVYSEFTADGYDLRRLDLSDSKYYIPIDKVESVSGEHRKEIVGEAPFASVGDSFAVTRFNKWSGILNPHSLLAEVNHPIASLRVLSDNKFGTMSGEAGVFYNYNEKEWSYGANLTYAELYPVINAGFVYANRSAGFVNYGPLTDTTFFRRISIREWSENRFGLGASVPLEWIKGNLIQSFQARAQYRFIDVNVDPDFDPVTAAFTDTIPYEDNRLEVASVFTQPISSGSFHSIDLGLSYQLVKRRARLHVRPKLGAGFGMRYRASLGDKGLGGDVFSAGVNFFLPGIARNHSVRLSANFQKERRLDNYRFSDLFVYPRGYDLSLRRDEFHTWRVEYMLPLFYPDMAIGPLAFVKRIKANAFFDHGVFKLTEDVLPKVSSTMRSVGFELNIDFRAFRLVEMDLGLRYSYLLDDRFTTNSRRHVFDFFVVSITQ